MNNPQTQGLAQFVSGITYEQIPADVRERLRAAVSALAASLGEASRGTQGPASLKSG